MSCGKVCSRDMLFSSRSSSSSRASSPHARRCRWRAECSPTMGASCFSGVFCRSAMVWIPNLSSSRWVTRPTPQMRLTGNGARNRAAASRPSGTTVSPSGFSRSLASLARNLLHATPTDAVRPVSLRTSDLMRVAMACPSPKCFCDPVTSRKASSMESGSMMGVKRSKMPMICRDASR